MFYYSKTAQKKHHLICILLDLPHSRLSALVPLGGPITVLARHTSPNSGFYFTVRIAVTKTVLLDLGTTQQ